VDKKRITGMLFVMMASTCWGTTGILQAIAPAGTHPLSIGSIRVVIAGIAMLFYSVCRRKSIIRQFRIAPLIPLVITVAGVMGYQFAFFSALKLTGVSIGSMIAIGAAPVIAGIFGFLFEGELLTRKWMLSTAVAISGCILMIGGGMSSPVRLHPLGIILAFTAAFSYATLGLGMKKLEKKLTIVETATVATIGSMIVGLPALLKYGWAWILTGRGMSVALTLGVFTEAIPMCLFAVGLRKVYLRDAYTLSLCEPLTACLLSALILGEKLGFIPLLGVFLIFCGILLLPVNSSKTEPGKNAGNYTFLGHR
jgi:DME family drug/metabolite transporter